MDEYASERERTVGERGERKDFGERGLRERDVDGEGVLCDLALREREEKKEGEEDLRADEVGERVGEKRGEEGSRWSGNFGIANNPEVEVEAEEEGGVDIREEGERDRRDFVTTSWLRINGGEVHLA